MTKYLIDCPTQRVGPLTVEQIRDLLDSGEVTMKDRAWAPGMSGWETVESLGLDYAPSKSPDPPRSGDEPPPTPVADSWEAAQEDNAYPGTVGESGASSNGGLGKKLLIVGLPGFLVVAGIGGVAIVTLQRILVASSYPSDPTGPERDAIDIAFRANSALDAYIRHRDPQGGWDSAAQAVETLRQGLVIQGQEFSLVIDDERAQAALPWIALDENGRLFTLKKPSPEK